MGDSANVVLFVVVELDVAFVGTSRNWVKGKKTPSTY